MRTENLEVYASQGERKTPDEENYPGRRGWRLCGEAGIIQIIKNDNADKLNTHKPTGHFGNKHGPKRGILKCLTLCHVSPVCFPDEVEQFLIGCIKTLLLLRIDRPAVIQFQQATQLTASVILSSSLFTFFLRGKLEHISFENPHKQSPLVSNFVKNKPGKLVRPDQSISK